MSSGKLVGLVKTLAVMLALVAVAVGEDNETGIVTTEAQYHVIENNTPDLKSVLQKLKTVNFSKQILSILKKWFSGLSGGKYPTAGISPMPLSNLFEQRTFAGHRKRMQFALLPIMYKMGVMTTLLCFLTVLTLKGLTIGVILLIFAFGTIFTKFAHFGHPKENQWTSQPIHVHLHSPTDAHPKTASYVYSPGSHGWDRIAEASPTTYLEYIPRLNKIPQQIPRWSGIPEAASLPYPEYIPHSTIRWELPEHSSIPRPGR